MSVEKTAVLPVSADEAFALITDPDRLRRWQTVSARVDLRAGGEYRWTVVPGHVAAGTYREVEPGRRVVFGWGWDGAPDLGPDASTVTVTLEPADGGTLVRLVHEGLTEEQATSHAEGWEHFLERLQRAAVTGDAGPDEWAAVPAELNQLTSADATLAVCQHVLRGVTEADRDRRTPCTEFTVAELLDHLEGSLVKLGSMAGGEVDRASSGDAESRLAFVAQQTLEAWQRRGLEGTVKGGDSEMPATFAAGILSIELLVHAWDLAAATGQKVPASEALTGYVLELAEQTISRQLRAGGSFAETVEVGADAPVMDRLVAFSGRTLA
ncbi:MAG: TIGR03086 family metal-binding protein [Actinomycetota bacterium]|nr:TIGR03086 family metal-binding protein [Actinomycetota bacterium]